MSIIEIKEFVSPTSINKVPRKELILRCDWCCIIFSRKTNVPRTIKRSIHFCSNACAGQYKMKNLPQVRATIDNFYKFHKKVKTNKKYAEEVKKKREKTNIEKYGTKTPLESKEIQDRCNNTLKERYGVDNPLKNSSIKEKVQKTNLEKYGSVSPFGSDDVKKKSKEKIRKKFGVDHPMFSLDIKNKMIKTNLDRYGVENPGQLEEFINKAKKTSMKKYGAEHAMKTDRFKKHFQKWFIDETNECVLDWWRKMPSPKPSKATIQQLLKTSNIPPKNVSLIFLENLVQNYKEHKTRLETAAEKLFETKHFNKKPKQIKRVYRPDFKLNPTIFLNVDGLYWHSEAVQQDKKYHFNLRKEFEENNLRVFQFREDEVRDKPDIVKSIVDNALGKTKNKIFARKCELKQVKQKEASDFLQKNHLMGSTNAKHLGLYFENQLVSLLSFKQRKHICKIERFCSLVNTNVVGGFSKLLNYLEKNCLDPKVLEIHNWVDLRYGTGNHLKAKGFRQIKETLGWKWTDFNQTYNRLKCRANMDQRKLTQQEHADELGWVKIYDAGQRLFIKTN